MFGSELTRANQRDGKGAGIGRETGGGEQGPFWAKHFPYLYPQLQSRLSLLLSTPMKMERIESIETSVPKAQTPGDYQKDTIRQQLFCFINTHFEITKYKIFMK